MNSFFIVLLLVAIVVLIVGLTNPEKVKMKSRKKVSLVFGSAIIVIFILIGVTAEPNQSASTPPVASDTNAVATSTPTSQTTKPVSQPVVAKQTAPQATIPVTTPAPVLQQPTPTPQPITLLDISGSGGKSTQVFTVPSNEWQLGYTYDCSSFGDQGNFQVYIYNSDGSMSDAQGVNELGKSGSDTEYYHQSGSYYLEVNSECSWTIKVKG